MALAKITLLSLLMVAASLARVAAGSAQTAQPVPVEPPTQTVEQELARTMFETAIEKSARGEWNDALDLLVRSRALVDRPVTAMNQALMLARMSRMREAIRVLEEARSLTHSPEDDELITRIEQLRAEIAPLVGELSIRVVPPSATVTVDGTSAAPLEEGTILLAIDPGPHRIEATAADYLPTRLELTLARGERRALDLVLSPTPAPRKTASENSPPNLEVEAPRADPSRPIWRSGRLWGPVGAVVVAAVVTGVVIALRADDGGQEPDGGSSGRTFSPP